MTTFEDWWERNRNALERYGDYKRLAEVAWLAAWKSATVAAMSDVKAIIRATIEEVLGVRGECIAEKLPVWNQYLREYVPGEPAIAPDRPPGSQRP